MTLKEYSEKIRIKIDDLMAILPLYNLSLKEDSSLSNEEVARLNNTIQVHRATLNGYVYDLKKSEVDYIDGVIKEYENVIEFATDENIKAYAQEYLNKFKKMKEQSNGKLVATETTISHDVASYTSIIDEVNPLTSEAVKIKVRNLEKELESIIGTQGKLVAEERKKAQLEKELEGAKHFKTIREMRLNTCLQRIENYRISASVIKRIQTTMINENLDEYYKKVNKMFGQLEIKATKDLQAIVKYNKVVKKVDDYNREINNTGDTLLGKAKKSFLQIKKYCAENQMKFLEGWNQLFGRDVNKKAVPVVETPVSSPSPNNTEVNNNKNVNEIEKLGANLVQMAKSINQASNDKQIVNETIQTDNIEVENKPIDKKDEKRQAILNQINKANVVNKYESQIEKHRAMMAQIAESSIIKRNNNYMDQGDKPGIENISTVQPNFYTETSKRPVSPNKNEIITTPSRRKFTNLVITKVPAPGALLVKAGKAYRVKEDMSLENFTPKSKVELLIEKFENNKEKMTIEELEELKLAKDFSPRDLGFIDGLIERKRNETVETLSM